VETRVKFRVFTLSTVGRELAGVRSAGRYVYFFYMDL
jgi:hypothetical protein